MGYGACFPLGHGGARSNGLVPPDIAEGKKTCASKIHDEFPMHGHRKLSDPISQKTVLQLRVKVKRKERGAVQEFESISTPF